MRKLLIGVVFLIAVYDGAAFALDGSVGVGLTFSGKSVHPFAGMDGGNESSSSTSTYDGAWISGPSSNGRGNSGSGSARGPSGSVGSGLGAVNSGRLSVGGPAGSKLR
jgi:hypothetical protein